MISGNLVGSYSSIGKTFILVDEEGNEITGVCVDNPVVFTASASEDIRKGKIAATDDGVVTGSAIIPNYYTNTGYRLIPNGGSFVLPLGNYYNYTKFQAIICTFNTSSSDSVSAEYIAVEDKVFAVQSADALSSIIKKSENTSVDFCITNTSGKSCLIRYFTYKELY